MSGGRAEHALLQESHLHHHHHHRIGTEAMLASTTPANMRLPLDLG
jgi:hypothetical protein